MMETDRYDLKPKVKSHRLNILPDNPEHDSEERLVGPGRFPSWLHRKLPQGAELWNTGKIVEGNRLHTVCEEAKCPNLFECWSNKTATFLALGKACTRSCGFCDIDFTKAPQPPEKDEPHRIADSVKKLELKHVVITMVARDDLEDGGAAHMAAIVREIRQHTPDVTIELLTSDFHGNLDNLNLLLDSAPEIFNHNIETVRSYTHRVRHTATYDRTLAVLHHAASMKANPDMLIKSGLMLGFGEELEEIKETLRDLKQAGCHIVTIGQYLQPNRHKLRVKSFIHPDTFKELEDYGRSIGIEYMYCGPFIRSSYNAGLVMKNYKKESITINSH